MSAATLVKQAQDAGVHLYLVDGKIKGRGKPDAIAKLIEPLRQHKADLIRWFSQSASNDAEPSPDPATWRELAAAYYRHHFNCPTCIAAGRGAQYGLRCGAGAALWIDYFGSVE